ncbi:MAG: hypothetical protein ACRC28_18460 [Clostridium sp.]|uniref:hypothetical protein n=1 Tax=Clostridium sp. TaxID=1506 RepID=UPI003F2CC852
MKKVREYQINNMFKEEMITIEGFKAGDKIKVVCSSDSFRRQKIGKIYTVVGGIKKDNRKYIQIKESETLWRLEEIEKVIENKKLEGRGTRKNITKAFKEMLQGEKIILIGNEDNGILMTKDKFDEMKIEIMFDNGYSSDCPIFYETSYSWGYDYPHLTTKKWKNYIERSWFKDMVEEINSKNF